MTDFDPNSFLEPKPTPGELALWDRFVAEYVKDFRPIAACIRVGFNATFAEAHAPDKDRIAAMRKRVESTFLAAMECGDPKVAVAAAAKLGEMHGFMEAPDKSGEELKEVVNFFKDVAKALPD
jgi:hypothetical protein